MKMKIGRVSELKENQIQQKSTKNFQVCLLKREDQIFVFEDVCSHDGESISEGELDGDCITCPRHMARFSIKTGEALCMPATEPIRIFPVSIVGDEIEIEMEDI